MCATCCWRLFLHSHWLVFPAKLGALSDEYSETFQCDIATMENRYESKWNPSKVADYWWALKHATLDAEYMQIKIGSTMLFAELMQDVSIIVWLNTLNLKSMSCFSKFIYVTQGPKIRRLSFLAFLFYHILHCICFKIPFTESKYLVSNWSYTSLIRTIKKVKNRIKSLRFFMSS